MDCDRRGSSSSADSSVLFPTYKVAANSLTQLYNESMNMQKEAFRAGEKNALEQIWNWMLTKMQDGAIMSVNEISGHLKTMLYPNNEPSPRSTVEIQDITPESEALPFIGVEQPKLKYTGYESMSVDLNVPYNPDVPGY